MLSPLDVVGQMSGDSTGFGTLMQRIAAGSEEAAWELVSNYARHVERIIRRTMRSSLRARFDTVDYAQAVWASFFRERERFAAFESEERLIGFLIGIARNKVLQESRRGMEAAKRDVRREAMLDEGGTVNDFAGTGGTPSQWAIARERWESIVRSLSAEHRDVIRMRMSGATYAEISLEIGINERTARRVVDKLATEMER
jgi:RNA polymerase sigma factor (sigma-70 family)